MTAAAAAAAVRLPSVAGRFYPLSAKALEALVESLLKAAPNEKVPGEIVAVLVPHAGLEYSGATAARAYKLLAPGHWDTVVVLGTGHYKELEGAAIYPGAYATPEGSLEYDAALAGALVKTTSLIKLDARAHDKEHSIEVQVPFLRYRLGSVKIVGMVMNTQDLESARIIGRALASAIKGKRVLLVASSDQSHYPSGPLSDIVDRTTLEALKTLDPAYFWLTNRLLMNRGLESLAVTYCGEGAVTAVMTAARELGATQARVLSHINSGDVVSERDYHHVVGYAAVVFLKGVSAAVPAALDGSEKKELLVLARRSIEGYLASGKMPAVALSKDPRLNLPAAVFVTLEKASGELRGCIGSLQAQESLVESVAHNAVASAVSDSRFKPVQAAELPGLRIEVSRLSQSKEVKSASEIRKGDGVIVEEGGSSGVFLPQVWEQLKDKESFLGELCSQKAHLSRQCWKDSAARLKVFSVEIVRE
ncbi:MAG: AmmeMemoRadiSam system protein B [Elusimicrobia bacterium]|nr:AmmeMemoRadiSam system protein B [Elusimicrobiota bacterium]